MTLLEQLTGIVGEAALSTWTEPSSDNQLPLATPSDEAACLELIKLASDDGLALLPIGFGSKTSQTAAAKRVDFALSTQKLSGVEAYAPGDGTITARAGTTISQLRKVVGEGGHRFTPDVPHPERATLGGIIAAGQSGFDRLRFGPLRNHVLGMTVLLADGTRALSGGRLVKNVTGYDLHRLYAGSQGSLCLIIEASMRLFPLPESELVFTGTTPNLASALEAVAHASELPLTWDTLSVTRFPSRSAEGADRFRVLASLSGRTVLLTSHSANVEAALGGLSELTRESSNAAVETRESARDRERECGAPHLRLLCKPSLLAQQAEWLLSALHDLGETAPSLAIHPGIASLELWLNESDVEARRDLLLELVEVATRHRLRIDWPASEEEFPQARKSSVVSPPALALMTRLQASLDPSGVFARGRLHPEL